MAKLVSGSIKSSHRQETIMKFRRLTTATITALLVVMGAASAEKSGGTLRVYHRDSPASMSIYEETTISTSIPMMGVFNNLVVFDPHQTQNRLDDIIPDL